MHTTDGVSKQAMYIACAVYYSYYFDGYAAGFGWLVVDHIISDRKVAKFGGEFFPRFTNQRLAGEHLQPVADF